MIGRDVWPELRRRRQWGWVLRQTAFVVLLLSVYVVLWWVR